MGGNLLKTIEISQKLRHDMEKVLTEDRFDHTLGVAYTAAAMASSSYPFAEFGCPE